MRPVYAAHNETDRSSSDSKFVSKKSLCLFPIAALPLDFSHLFLGQFGSSCLFSTGSVPTAFLGTIPVILCGSSQEQVIGVAADGAITPMANIHALGDFLIIGKFPSQSVSVIPLAIGKEFSVALCIQAAGPVPTLICPLLGHLLPEDFLGVFLVAILRTEHQSPSFTGERMPTICAGRGVGFHGCFSLFHWRVLHSGHSFGTGVRGIHWYPHFLHTRGGGLLVCMTVHSPNSSSCQ